jgi:hypothetical protein
MGSVERRDPDRCRGARGSKVSLLPLHCELSRVSDQHVRAYAEPRLVLKPRDMFLSNAWDRIEENELADTITTALRAHFAADPPRFLARTLHGYHDVTPIARNRWMVVSTPQPRLFVSLRPAVPRERAWIIGSGRRAFSRARARQDVRNAQRRDAGNETDSSAVSNPLNCVPLHVRPKSTRRKRCEFYTAS